MRVKNAGLHPDRDQKINGKFWNHVEMCTENFHEKEDIFEGTSFPDGISASGLAICII